MLRMIVAYMLLIMACAGFVLTLPDRILAESDIGFALISDLWGAL